MEVVVTIRVKPRWAASGLAAAGRFPLFFLTRSFGVAGLCVALFAHTITDVPVLKPLPARIDPRAARLEKFFELYACPAPHYVGEYLKAADEHGLDYRLLPAVSIRETQCGQAQWENNRWGYHPGLQRFPSVLVGIDFMAWVLVEGEYYKGKTLEQKLLMYNHRPAYTDEVKGIMRQIEPR
jgi:hypothetical protein